VQFRIADGNTNDSITHIETWNTLKSVAGRPDFLYVADSKLCSHENLDTIARAGGRFVTVLPRSRQEDRQFRKRIQTTTPPWELIWDRPDSRGRDGPRDQWYLYRDPIGSMEAWPIVWVWSKHLTGHQRASRRRRIDAALEALSSLRGRIVSPRARIRGASRTPRGCTASSLRSARAPQGEFQNGSPGRGFGLCTTGTSVLIFAQASSDHPLGIQQRQNIRRWLDGQAAG